LREGPGALGKGKSSIAAVDEGGLYRKKRGATYLMYTQVLPRREGRNGKRWGEGEGNWGWNES